MRTLPTCAGGAGAGSATEVGSLVRVCRNIKQYQTVHNITSIHSYTSKKYGGKKETSSKILLYKKSTQNFCCQNFVTKVFENFCLASFQLQNRLNDLNRLINFDVVRGNLLENFSGKRSLESEPISAEGAAVRQRAAAAWLRFTLCRFSLPARGNLLLPARALQQDSSVVVAFSNHPGSGSGAHSHSRTKTELMLQQA